MSRDSRDISCLKRMTKRYAELAGMLKEKFRGNQVEFDKIVAKFAIQEGLTLKKANASANVLELAGMISWTEGKKEWVYNPKAEWDLFKINI